jgi:acetyl esterase/lipase
MKIITLLKLTLVFSFAIIPINGFCQVDYDHQQDIVYGYKDGLAMVMDVYTPEEGTNKAGIIIVMAGGMTSSPVWSHYAGDRSDVKKFLESGYTVFATAHSSQPKYNVDEIRGDVQRAIRFIRYNAERFGIIPSKLGIIGYSSGAQITLMAATSDPQKFDESGDPIDLESSKVNAVVAYYPGTDMLNFGKANTTILDHFHSLNYNLDAAFDFHQWNNESNRFERINDSDSKIKYYSKNSPVNHVTEDDPPILLIHGDQDKLVPIQQSELMANQLKVVGVNHKFLVMKGQGHGWKTPLKNEMEDVLGWFNKYLIRN